MNALLTWLVPYCIKNQIIAADEEALLRYGLERRLSTLLVLIPFSIVAVYLSDFWTASFYIGSYFYLRAQTNGFHAKTHLGCLIGSLLLEIFFLFLIEPLLNSVSVILLILVSAPVILGLAPYNHPKMNLDYTEYSACKRASRIRMMQLAFLCAVFIQFGLIDISKGIALGCAMASVLLVFANIAERKMKNDSISDQDKPCSANSL